MPNDPAAKVSDRELGDVISLKSGHATQAVNASETLSLQANEIGMTGLSGGAKRVGLVVGEGLLDAPKGVVATIKSEGVTGIAANMLGSAAFGFGMKTLMSKAAPVAEYAAIGMGLIYAAKAAPGFYDAVCGGLNARTWKEMDHAQQQFGKATGGLVFDSLVGVGGYKLGAGAAGRMRFGSLDALAPGKGIGAESTGAGSTERVGITKPVGENLAALKPVGENTALKPLTEVAAGPKPGLPGHDIDGRLLTETAARREVIESKFAPIADADKPALRQKVETELKDVKATGVNGENTNVYQSLMQDTKLSSTQKQNIIDNLGIVREHFASYRLGERMHPDPEVNWIHTQGELGKVLEAGRAKNLSANDLEDSLLSSMYSDAVKFAAPAPEGITPNFHTHHLDGALAADHSLRLQNYPADRANRIIEGVLAHQIAPPKFMGQLYEMKINGALEGMIKEGKVSPEEGQAMRQTLADMTEVDSKGVKRITQLANVNTAPRVTNAEGMQQVAFTPEQQKVFALSGTDRWILPYDPAFDPKFAGMTDAEKAVQLSRQNIARNLIDGDGVDNYATTGGASKIVAIRGPGTYFPDPTVWHSISSIDASYHDAYSVLTPEGQVMADRALTSRNLVTDKNSGSLKTYLDTWLKDAKGLDVKTDQIPFYNSELAYPKPGEALTPEQTEQMNLAKEIRSKTVDFLRSDHRTDNSLPGLFEPVRGTGK